MIRAATSHRPAATTLPTRAWSPVAAAISAWNSRSRCGSRNVSVTGLRDPIEVEVHRAKRTRPAMAVRSGAARHPDVVELDLEQVARPAVHRLEPQPDASGPRTDPSRSRPSATRHRRPHVARRSGRPRPCCRRTARRSRAACRPTTTPSCGRRHRRTSGAGRRWPAGRSAGIGSSSVRRGRSRSRMRRRTAPVTNAFEPERVVPSCFGPWLDVDAGLARTNRPLLDVSVWSGSTTNPRATSRSSSNAPQRAIRTERPRTESGQPDCSIRYRTASLFRPVSEAMSESSG